MMRTLKILLFLFISCLCFGCQSSLRRESRIEKQDDVYVLSFANLSFSVSAGKGGRIVSFKCEDRELLTSDSVLIDGKRRQEREEEVYQVKLQEYENNLGQYQLRLSEIESENQKKRDMYGKQLVAYSEEVADYVNRSNTERDVLFDAKWKLQAALRNLYEEGIIYPKYQNLVAVSTIYEYLASGRCDRLEGPNGAYNLYEMELRQNIVIGQLSTITEHLEQIKENQYTLYYEIQSANNNSASMLSSISRTS